MRCEWPGQDLDEGSRVVRFGESCPSFFWSVFLWFSRVFKGFLGLSRVFLGFSRVFKGLSKVCSRVSNDVLKCCLDFLWVFEGF